MKEYYELQDIAVLIDRTPRTVRNWIKSKDFPEPITVIKGRPKWTIAQISDWKKRKYAEKRGNMRKQTAEK